MDYEILTNPRAVGVRVFEEDFNRVASYFSDIIEERSWAALPGGVVDTFVPSSASYEPLTLRADDFRGYRMDTGRYIASNKKAIAAALSVVEGRALDSTDFTLCPSVSFGLLVIMLALKRESIQTIVTELPTYFACVEQALALGFRVLLWPTLANERYIMTPADVHEMRAHIDGPMALLITQPRYGMGFCRDANSTLGFREQLKPGDTIVIDEAADQIVPAMFGTVSMEGEVTIIRVRGLVKGLGLNSAKVAAIFHPRKLRGRYSEIIDYAGGALDAASLMLVTRLCQEPGRYIDLLRAAQRYVQQQKTMLGRLLMGLPVALSPIESGYIGTAHISLPGRREEFENNRQRFLQICRTHRMPVVLGSSMYFPYAGTEEIIRINYFTEAENLRASAGILAKISSEIRQQS